MPAGDSHMPKAATTQNKWSELHICCAIGLLASHRTLGFNVPWPVSAPPLAVPPHADGKSLCFSTPSRLGFFALLPPELGLARFGLARSGRTKNERVELSFFSIWPAPRWLPALAAAAAVTAPPSVATVFPSGTSGTCGNWVRSQNLSTAVPKIQDGVDAQVLTDRSDTALRSAQPHSLRVGYFCCAGRSPFETISTTFLPRLRMVPDGRLGSSQFQSFLSTTGTTLL